MLIHDDVVKQREKERKGKKEKRSLLVAVAVFLC